MDDPLVELTAGPTVEVAPVVVELRAAIRVVIDDLLAVPDAALEAPWRWRPDDPADADVRYGFYRIHERLEAAAVAIVRDRAVTGERVDPGPAVPLFGPTTAARWELRAALAPLTADELDADPGGGEWTVRQTLAHVVGGQRAYGWYTAWWFDRGHVGEPLPAEAGDDRMPALPDEADEATGPLTEILSELDDLVDLAGGRFASLDDRGLAVPARWSGLPVDVRFRLGRMGSHIREHTIQVDKTMVMLARPTTEAERLVRLIGGSYGRLEGLVFLRSPAALEQPSATGGSTAGTLATVGSDIAATAAAVRRAAGASRG